MGNLTNYFSEKLAWHTNYVLIKITLDEVKEKILQTLEKKNK